MTTYAQLLLNARREHVTLSWRGGHVSGRLELVGYRIDKKMHRFSVRAPGAFVCFNDDQIVSIDHNITSIEIDWSLGVPMRTQQLNEKSGDI